jgi:uncharacterized membrane protein
VTFILLAILQDPLPPGANPTCPIMKGEKVDPAIFVESEGRRVYFCCTKCRTRFQSQPRPKFEPFLGKLHPLAVHFPIALLIAAALLELFKKREAAKICAALGAAGAVVAAILGWIAAGAKNESDSLTIHRWLGVGVAAVSVAAVLMYRRAVPYRIGLFAAALLVAAAGHYGAQLVYGVDYLFPPERVDFVRDIHPIFENSCAHCHGPEKQKGQLRLDSRESASKAIAPGKSEESRLIHRVTGHGGEERMPLEGAPLTDRQIALLRRWIDQGADWPESHNVKAAPHWAFVKPVRPEPPAVKNKAWIRNPIDAFVLARLEKEGLAPSPEASKETLRRRLYLDLVGLPPEDDAEPDERLIDRLLSSPHYGEKWARPWLDGARFADSHGWERDRPRPMWKYRDWVIRALNQDMPFARFTIEQIAGDMLPDATIDQRIATGFNRNSQWNEEGGVDPEEVFFESLVDRVNTTATVWLGLTLGCAQCHDHKFDPLPQKDYYRFMAFFANTDRDPYIDTLDTTPRYREPFLQFFAPAQEARRRELLREIARLEQVLDTPTPELDAAQAEWEKQADSIWTPIDPDGTRGIETVTGIRLEISDASPGFVLRRISVEAADTAIMRFSRAAATGSAPGRDVSDLVGAKRTGWSPASPAEHQIVLVTRRPYAGSELKFRIKQEGTARIRIALTNAPDPAAALVPPEIRNGPPEARAAYFRSITPMLQPVRDQIAQARKTLEAIRPETTTLVMRESSTDSRPWTWLRHKGNFLSRGEKLYANTPAALPPLPESELPNRLGLARWLVDESNPLTARVLVNRIWEQYFGRGLVETSEDFGTQGGRPSHPELLDWLATEFMREGWSLKKLHRTIVTSATYRQSSRIPRELLERDPQNRLLARASRFRIEAEMIRDSALSIGGLLSRKIGGPSVFPQQPEGIWSAAFTNFTGSWKASPGEDRHRRSIYTFWKRASPYPSFVNFDAPSREVCTIRRPRTNTPLQAMTTLNDPVYVEAARGLAARMKSEGGDGWISHGFRLCTGRRPKKSELDRLAALFEEFKKLPGAALAFGGQESAEEAARVAVANVLLNLDETLTRE